MRALYKLSRALSETPETRKMLSTAVEQLEEFYKFPVLLLTQGAQGDLEINAGDPRAFGWSENELSVARWVFDTASQRTDATFELIDLADHPLPHLDEPAPAARGRYEHEHTRRWAAAVASCDGFDGHP